MMTKILLLILLLSFISLSQQRGEIELVETTPIETTLDNPDIRDAYDVWLEMIKRAEKSLDIEQFYISPEKGEPLDAILYAIEDAAARGVRVRIIVDSRMYKTYPAVIDNYKNKLKYDGTPLEGTIETHVIDFGKIGGGIQHAKFFIVDDEELFLGSQNFDWRALKHIQELGIRLKHKEAVQVYKDIFEFDWRLSGNAEEARLKPFIERRQYATSMEIIESNNDTIFFKPTCSPKPYIADTLLWDEPNIVNLINSAKEEVYLQFLSYSTKARDKSTYSLIQDAMKNAAARGVKVKMIVSDWEKDHPGVDSLQALSTTPNIELKYMVIPEWSGGYISYARVVHSKLILVDGKEFWLGTSNCEKSYFYTSRNLGIVVKNNRLAKQLQNIFHKSWNSSYAERITIDAKYEVREHGERK
ncbi:MAG: hypothetical protein HY960_03290 [Ignavibacteriae bacterium]|nr:hypothetical protein [Ignavibacteriota bacterium]